MLKKSIFISILLLLIVSYAVFTFWTKPLTGKMVLSYDAISGDGPGIVTYDLSTKKISKILKKGYNNEVEYNFDKSKVLINAYSENKNGRPISTISEYDLKKKTSTRILKLPFEVGTVKYIPNSDSICYSKKQSLYFYNRKTKTTEKILKVLPKEYLDYTWSSNGQILYYSPDSKDIYSYDTKTKKSLFKFNGKSAVVSNNCKYVAYMDGKLKIKELSTGKIWSYNTDYDIWSYKFCDDDNYLVVIRHYEAVRPDVIYEVTLEAWDYKSDKNVNIFPDFKGGINGFDWK